MRGFLLDDGPISPPPPSKRVTDADLVRDYVQQQGVYLTIAQIVEATGISVQRVNSALSAGIIHGTIERLHPAERGRRQIQQEYRWVREARA